VPDDTRELITREQFQGWLLIAALATVFVALLVGAVWGRRRGAVRSGLIRGAAIASLGPAALALWWVYNLFEDRYGLDSILALGINLAIFVVFGALAGVAIGWTWRRTAPASGEAAAGGRRDETSVEQKQEG
jgi:hypothetical protein